MYKFENYVRLTAGIPDAQRRLRNVNSVLKGVGGEKPATEIDGKILAAILQEACVMKDDPDADVCFVDDIAVLYNFCVQNGVYPSEEYR